MGIEENDNWEQASYCKSTGKPKNKVEEVFFIEERGELGGLIGTRRPLG